MNPRVKKIVLVIQDLETKDKHNVAVVSGDIHLHSSSETKKNAPVSFQMLLSDNKDFARCIKDLSTQALALDAERKSK